MCNVQAAHFLSDSRGSMSPCRTYPLDNIVDKVENPAHFIKKSIASMNISCF